MNPMNLMQMFQNPQQFIQKMMGNSQIMQNPIMKNALKMAKSGDVKGVEELARNLCKEKGIDFDKSFSDFKNQFHL